MSCEGGGNRVQYTSTGDGLMFSTVGKVNGGEVQQNHCSRGTTLATQGTKENQDAMVGTDGKLFPDIRCYECNQYGHYASHYPQLTNTNKCESRQEHLTVSFSLTQ